MKIIEWNVNQRANHINTENLPSFIPQALKNEDPDFFVLTECYKVKHLETFIEAMDEYEILMTDNSCHHQNEVVIGVRKTFSGARVVSSMESGVENTNPNFLHVEVEVDGHLLNIMGVRIRVPKTSPSSVESQTYRLGQLDRLLDQIDSVPEPVVLVGDFNNYRRGLSPSTFEPKGEATDITRCAVWNMDVIRERFYEVGLDMYTPTGFSWGWENPNIKYQFAQDHAFIKGLNLAKNDFDGSAYCYYIDEFMNLAPEIYGKQGIKGVIPPYPDHKMLVIELDLLDGI